jgi:hypothetical protein
VYNRGHHCWQHEPRRPFTLQAPRGEPIETSDDEILASISTAQVRTHRASA